ncbi:hypothetical protein [uncultured Clostridium sp.]|jgi:uncharacterized protein YacL|uniref:hypothetical protein n=1 Tax=uncultured Clostridium sp. TaxID=59620 RepID=UPI00260D35CC|nr:hypothetical protein [uncultured Clostridium sp.]
MEENKISKKNTVVPLILGILSIPGALFAILGLILGIVGVALSAKGFKKSGMAKAALILSIIGIILSLASGVMGYVMIHHYQEFMRMHR